MASCDAASDGYDGPPSRHGMARGPVHAVVCENWVVYHYFNTQAGRYAMSVLEMFDDAEHRKAGAYTRSLQSST
mgnify:CR=1 FL=1|jgi:hypothetical protein